MKILIDVGHGGRNDTGAIANNVKEKDLNLQISSKLYTLLIAKGYSVNINRLKDREIPLKDRVDRCNELNFDLFLSIHCNAFRDEKVYGAETLHYPTSKNGKLIATKILDNIKLMTNIQHRNVKSDDRGLYVLGKTKCTAVLVECGFITNKEELMQLSNDTYQWILAIAIMKGVIEYEEEIR